MQNNHQNTKKCHVYTFKPSKVSHTVPAISRRLLPDPGVGYLAPMPRDPRALAQGPEEVRKERGVARLLEEERRDHDFRQGPARAASREKKIINNDATLETTVQMQFPNPLLSGWVCTNLPPASFALASPPARVSAWARESRFPAAIAARTRRAGARRPCQALRGPPPGTRPRESSPPQRAATFA